MSIVDMGEDDQPRDSTETDTVECGIQSRLDYCCLQIFVP